MYFSTNEFKMKLLTKQELDKLLTQVKDVLTARNSSIDRIFEEHRKDKEMIEKIRLVLFFFPIYYPKNVIVSQVGDSGKYYCRIKMEHYWKENYHRERQVFQDIFKIQPIITTFSEKYPRKSGFRPMVFMTDYISFYFQKKDITEGMTAEIYANSIATSNILKKLFPDIFDAEQFYQN